MNVWNSRSRCSAPCRARGLVLGLALAVLGCEKKEKPVVRTEPWPAPLVSASTVVTAGGVVPYVLDSSTVTIELRSKKRRIRGTLGELTGSVSFDPTRLERTRATLRADLLAMTLEQSDGAELTDGLMSSALRALELTPERPAEDRDRDRWAELRIIGFETTGSSPRDRREKKAQVTAFGELTVHRFRVPINLELQVEWVPTTQALHVKTRRPVTISFVAHDILPRDSSGAIVPRAASLLEAEFGREARVSAELAFRPASSPAAASSAIP